MDLESRKSLDCKSSDECPFQRKSISEFVSEINKIKGNELLSVWRYIADDNFIFIFYISFKSIGLKTNIKNVILSKDGSGNRVHLKHSQSYKNEHHVSTSERMKSNHIYSLTIQTELDGHPTMFHEDDKNMILMPFTYKFYTGYYDEKSTYYLAQRVRFSVRENPFTRHVSMNVPYLGKIFINKSPHFHVYSRKDGSIIDINDKIPSNSSMTMIYYQKKNYLLIHYELDNDNYRKILIYDIINFQFLGSIPINCWSRKKILMTVDQAEGILYCWYDKHRLASFYLDSVVLHSEIPIQNPDYLHKFESLDAENSIVEFLFDSANYYHLNPISAISTLLSIKKIYNDEYRSNKLEIPMRLQSKLQDKITCVDQNNHIILYNRLNDELIAHDIHGSLRGKLFFYNSIEKLLPNIDSTKIMEMIYDEINSQFIFITDQTLIFLDSEGWLQDGLDDFVWEPNNHHLAPIVMKQMVLLMTMIRNLHLESNISLLPNEILFQIFFYC